MSMLVLQKLPNVAECINMYSLHVKGKNCRIIERNLTVPLSSVHPTTSYSVVKNLWQ